jgi:hypothetical protein
LSAKLNAIQIADEVRVALNEQRVRLGGIEVPQNLDPTTRKAVEDAVRTSFVAGFRFADVDCGCACFGKRRECVGHNRPIREKVRWGVGQ